jgi:hypothetical protein
VQAPQLAGEIAESSKDKGMAKRDHCIAWKSMSEMGTVSMRVDDLSDLKTSLKHRIKKREHGKERLYQ